MATHIAPKAFLDYIHGHSVQFIDRLRDAAARTPDRPLAPGGEPAVAVVPAAELEWGFVHQHGRHKGVRRVDQEDLAIL